MRERDEPSPDDPAAEETGRDETAAPPPAAERAGPPPAEPARTSPAREFVGTGLFWSFIVGLLLAAAVIVLVAQNTEDVSVDWLVWEVELPLIVVILGSMFVAIVIDQLVGLIWRRRRRRALALRDELERLRDG